MCFLLAASTGDGGRLVAQAHGPSETRTLNHEDGSRAKVWTEVQHDGEWLRDGEFRRYHENGELAESGSYVVARGRSLKQGIWKQYLTNGAIEYETHYRWGRRHGEHISFHFAHGLHEANRKRSVTHYEDGVRHGRFLEYCRDGEALRRRGQYYLDKPSGVWETLLPWDCSVEDPPQVPRVEDRGNPRPEAPKAGDKPVRLSDKTRRDLAEFRELIEEMEDAQRTATLLGALGPFFNLMDGLDPVDLYEYWDGPWDSVRDAASGLSAAYRSDLRFFAMKAAIDQRTSHSDSLFWRKIADEFR